MYEPEKVIAQRTAKGGVSQFQVKWVSFDAKFNTWEPLEIDSPTREIVSSGSSVTQGDCGDAGVCAC